MKLLKSFKILVAISVVMATVIGCSTTKNRSGADIYDLKAERSTQINIPDSLRLLMINSDRIVCKLPQTSSGIQRDDSIRKVPTQLVGTVKYLFFNKNNFRSDDVIYGIFGSWANYEFYKGRKLCATLKLDFGLSKWKLYDSKSNSVVSGDLSDNMQFLHLTRLIWPNDQALKTLNDNLDTRKL